MVVYNIGQTIIGIVLACFFEAYCISKFSGKRRYETFFPHWILNRYCASSKDHVLPLSHSGPAGPEEKRIICFRNYKIKSFDKILEKKILGNFKQKL